MASRHRDIVSAVTDRENLRTKPVKELQKPPTRRPALDDLGNRLLGPRDALKKQPEPIKDPKKKPLAKENVPVAKKEPQKSYSAQRIDPIIDPDTDTNEPQMVAEYVKEIYDYLREMEIKYPIREKFLEGHRSTPKMRAVLVNWLVQVHSNFKLCLETLYLCISIVDRYLQSNVNIGRETLQLVGTSSLMVACKYEEIYMPDITDFVYVCDDAFSKKQILRMEMDILRRLDFGLGRPLPIHFLRRYSKIAQVQMEHHTLAKYILELGLIDHNMSHIKPSVQAAAACCLSLSILNDVTCPSKTWTPTLVHYTTYTYTDFKDVVIKFANLLLNVENSKHKSIQEKYATSAFSKISTNPKLRGTVVRKLVSLSPKS